MSDIYVFIGSSNESLKNAELIKSCLEPLCDCTIWNGNFFAPGSSTYRELARKAILFDYAVFVGGEDDTVLRNSTGDVRSNVRDNVYLEFGLYAGILTPDRTFFVMDKACQPASDLHGITMFIYENEDGVRKACKQIQAKIQTEEKNARFGFLPSTSLAYGYFKNYIQPVAKALDTHNEADVDGIRIDLRKMSKSLEVVIPKDVREDWESQAQIYFKQERMVDVSVEGNVRQLSMVCDKHQLAKNKFQLYDIPQTLRISFSVVDLVLAEGSLGITDENMLAREKEVSNFIKTLNVLTAQCPYSSKYVTIRTRKL